MKINEETRRSIATICLVFSLFLGGMGVACGGTSFKIIGGFLLAFAFILNFLAIGLMLWTMRETTKEETSDKDKLRKMLEDGTLKQYLKDIECEKTIISS